MTAKFSRKKYLEFYRRETSEEQEILRKFLKHDIMNHFNYLYFKGLFQIGNEENMIERVLSSEQIEVILDLYMRLSETSHAVKHLEKHFQKLQKAEV